MKRNLELPLALGAIGLTAIGAASGCTPEKEAQAKRMNIVYIMCDDHSYQTISAYGSPVSRLAPTPNIDRLASMGILFNKAYVENSLSTPSRACLMTGLYSHQNGQTMLSNVMDSTVTFIP
ncbi:MAG: sulfatase-like hydrolase/transferase, partial [Bacteroidales bacterium]|nr:sulfatase-like hydrolase/transferase [Bacteroidales bacterium]